jgi:hypothetical protein
VTQGKGSCRERLVEQEKRSDGNELRGTSAVTPSPSLSLTFHASYLYLHDHSIALSCRLDRYLSTQYDIGSRCSNDVGLIMARKRAPDECKRNFELVISQPQSTAFPGYTRAKVELRCTRMTWRFEIHGDTADKLSVPVKYKVERRAHHQWRHHSNQASDIPPPLPSAPTKQQT